MSKVSLHRNVYHPYKVFTKPRWAKVNQKALDDEKAMGEWLADLRYYLIEAQGVMTDVIIADFKAKMKGTRNRFFKATRMHEYVAMALPARTIYQAVPSYDTPQEGDLTIDTHGSIFTITKVSK
ncbi:hypothetical protein D3C78_1460390 [compost metagenome]